MLLIVEKGVRGGISYFIYRYAKKLVTNTWKIKIKIRNPLILNVGM